MGARNSPAAALRALEDRFDDALILQAFFARVFGQRSSNGKKKKKGSVLTIDTVKSQETIFLRITEVTEA